MEEIHDNGGSIETEARTITRVERLNPGNWLVWTTLAPTRYTETADGELLTLEGGGSLLRVELRRHGGSFILRDYVRRVSD